MNKVLFLILLGSTVLCADQLLLTSGQTLSGTLISADERAKRSGVSEV